MANLNSNLQLSAELTMPREDSVSPIVLTIVIVNYNGKHFLNDCIKSIREKVKFSHEIIIIDNNSADGSVEYLQRTFPEITLIASPRNLGFSAGNNLGAEKGSGKYLLLLNNDTILLNDLQPAISLFETDESIGALSIKMVGKNHEYRHSAGYFPSPSKLVKFSSLYVRNNGFDTGEFGVGQVIHDVEWVEGSFLLTRMSSWRKLGGLNDAYFMYVEDIDFARRIADEGLRVVYFSQLTYLHFGGYGQSRIGMLISGFRRYHDLHSNWGIRILANLVLDIGLVARATLYFVRSLGTPAYKTRALLCLQALRRN